MFAKNKKLVIIIGAVALVIVLYFQSTQIVSDKQPASASTDYFTTILAEAKGSLKREELEPIKRLDADLAKANDAARLPLLDSMAHVWQRLQVPALAAHYFEEKVKQVPAEKDEMEAAASYYDAFGVASDTGLKAFLIQGAIRNYEKVMAQDPDNLDAKSAVALCYAEGTNNPMQGIMLLREVVTKDPKNETAQYNLGLLSVRSGQLQKAIERFNTVLEINPKRYDVYFLRGSTYMRLNDKESALKDFEKVKTESGNTAMASEADTYIKQIKKL